MKLLFIDSNIFLNFYHFYDEDLEQLNKLVEFIKKGEIKLFLTTQVEDEIKRNRENKLSDAYKRFLESECLIKMPVFCKHYSEYADIKRIQEIINRIKSILGKKIFDDIEKGSLKADKIISDLISVAEIINSDKYLPKAITRYRLGRPPGKNKNSCGDQVNWEALLAEVGDSSDFIIISADSDYINRVDENKLKDYLTQEWKSCHKKDIFLYKSLGSFFREHDIKIELKIEQEKEKLISELVNSFSFNETHSVISQLSKYDSFSNEQIKELGAALLQNAQVLWIINDYDVKSFYQKQMNGKSDIFTTQEWESINDLINEEKCPEIDDNLDEIKEIEKKYLEEEVDVKDIPF